MLIRKKDDDGREYIHMYLFMPYKYLYHVLSNDRIKAVLPEDCNDPLEFEPAGIIDPRSTRFKNGMGMVCFSETMESPTMWGHYADHHQGVCLEFKFYCSLDKIDFSSELRKQNITYKEVHQLDFSENCLQQFWSPNETHMGLLFKVIYQENRPNGEGYHSEYNNNDGQESFDLSPVYYHKAEDWQYEKEYRLFLNLSKCEVDEQGNFFVRGLTQYISRIIVGVHSKNHVATVFATVKSLLRDKDSVPDIKRAEFHPTQYKVVVNDRSCTALKPVRIARALGEMLTCRDLDSKELDKFAKSAEKELNSLKRKGKRGRIA